MKYHKSGKNVQKLVVLRISFDFLVTDMKKNRFPKKIRYYSGFNEDFEATVRAREDFFDGYEYVSKKPLFRFISFFAHNVIAPPIAFFYSRVIMRERIIGKKKLKHRGGMILYFNHTEPVGDALCPHTYVFPKMAYTVVSPDNFALPVLGKIIGYLGAVPTPADVKSARGFSECLRYRLNQKSAIVVFPEAHVWQGYIGIRPMDKSAFSFPDKYSVPAFSLTRVYKKSRFFGFKRQIYVDGPFYPDTSLPRLEATEKMMADVIEAMCKRAQLSDVEIIKYIRKDS